MLKSLGQWTAPTIKPRTIIPSKLTTATMTVQPDTGNPKNQDKKTQFDWQDEIDKYVVEFNDSFTQRLD